MYQIEKIANRVIEYSFYAIFFFVPLVFTSSTSELFELNKMWLTFGLTIIIASAWFCKMIVQKRFFVQRTPLDIPIVLFVTAHIISTFISLDTHISLWGYYSRFNGGLLSILSYAILFYAFVSNIKSIDEERKNDPKKQPKTKLFYFFGFITFVLGIYFYTLFPDSTDAFANATRFWTLVGFSFASFFLFVSATTSKMLPKIISISLISGGIVALWGLPSHFGYDPTCLIFRGSFDVSCWTEAFQPKVRIFSTLGQPNWLSAYLGILIPIAIAKAILIFQKKEQKTWDFKLSAFGYTLLAVLFFIDIIFTRSQSGFAALGIGLGAFFLLTIVSFQKISQKNNIKPILIPVIILILITFVVGTPIERINAFTLPSLLAKFQHQLNRSVQSAKPTQSAGEFGGTDSFTIRKFVWSGAIEAWKQAPFFGTGVESFAFAYYRYKPVGHNLTSEWDYLYNKAHNEFLNYLTTTGIFGLGSYLAMIILTIFFIFRYGFLKEDYKGSLFSFALLGSYLVILITNFFGFSVVIVNLYFFLIPAFVFLIHDELSPEKVLLFGSKPAVAPRAKNKQTVEPSLNFAAWVELSTIVIVSFWMLMTLNRYYNADKQYALGSNYDHAGEYQTGYKLLINAINLRSNEPVFKDELSISQAVLATAFAYQKDATTAAELATSSIQLSNELTSQNPNNVVFWKSRFRMFYLLSQINPSYNKMALEAAQRTEALAPTDAKVAYNLGLLYGQTGNTQKGITVLEDVVKRLKPDYRDAWYALGLLYHQAAIDENKKIIKPDMQQKAVDSMRYIVDHFGKNDKEALDALKSWEML